MHIHDAFNDPYAQKYYGRLNRKSFEALKRTVAFKEWREEQRKLQQGRCAYCKIPLTVKNIVTHVDHIQPLRFDGTNDFSNLCLACRRCNTKKYIATNRVMPEWVKKRKLDQERWKSLRELRRQQGAIMRELVEQELDEQIAEQLRWIKEEQ